MSLADRIAVYARAFEEAGGDEALGEAEKDYVSDALTGPGPREGTLDLEEIAWSFETLGLESFNAEADEAHVADIFARAFRARRTLWARAEHALSVEDAWLLVASGVLANRQPELRQLLTDLDWGLTFGEPPAPWDERLIWQSTRALVHLARKGGGWADIDTALDALNELRALQAGTEPAFLASATEEQEAEGPRFLLSMDEAGKIAWQEHLGDSDPLYERLAVHQRLVGLYHLAEALLELGGYLRTGSPDRIALILRRHGEHSRHLLSQQEDSRLARISQTLAPVTIAMARASIWSNTTRLSQAAREFVNHLTSRDRDDPVLELWWSQREALGSNLLDPFQRAISVQMPTSAGKTLLAEFAIIQALALNPESTVAYLVPTRALVTQITRRLRADLEGVALGGRSARVESAVPVFELDPTEDMLLSERPEILVMTPEKLDLLIRSRHDAVADLALVVADEAHHISDPSRGARLELLLGTLKRERGDRCRFLLLTPFLPNADELAEWLGDAEHTAIELDWKPSEQIRAIGKWRRAEGLFHNQLILAPSATQPLSWAGHEIELGPAVIQPAGRSRPLISASIAIALSEAEHGGVLILTKGPGTAEDRALQIAQAANLLNATAPEDRALLNAASEYVANELGEDYPLVRTLERGVAYHHAGLPPEIRSLVETLLERGVVRAVAGTSTLAQGVNFPLAAVVVEILTIPQGRGRPHRDLTFAEFWNIAGRAGRALKDRVGTVVWPSTSPSEDQRFHEYLEREAVTVISALTETITRLTEEGVELNLQLVRNQPALSQFLQFMAHALRVAGYERAVGEVEDILRSSLIYRRLRRGDPDVAEALVRWARRFFGEIQGNRLLPIADVTGFSLPSVGLMAAQAPEGIRSAIYWTPETLFGEDPEPFTELIELLGNVPELSLASNEPGGMNAARVAGIVRDWVGGATLPQIAETWYPNQPLSDSLRSTGRYLFRDLVGQVPWGLGALQAIGLGTESSDDPTVLAARRVPALTFYGVDRPDALAIRMVGVPRAAALALGRDAPEFASFSDARRWVDDLTENEWDEAGRVRGIRGSTLKTLWSAIGGTAA